MKRVGIVYLITEAPEARGVLDAATETRRKTYCEEKSLSMSEVYQANATGFSPSIRLLLPQDFEYRGETVCEYKGERYRIIRDYRDEKTGNSTELTLERIRGNAAPPAPDPEPEPEDTPDEQAQGGIEGSGAPVGQSPEGDSDQNESAETSGENANSGEAATIEDAEEQSAPAPTEGGEP